MCSNHGTFLFFKMVLNFLLRVKNVMNKKQYTPPNVLLSQSHSLTSFQLALIAKHKPHTQGECMCLTRLYTFTREHTDGMKDGKVMLA